jgi:hypothetical protein
MPGSEMKRGSGVRSPGVQMAQVYFRVADQPSQPVVQQQQQPQPTNQAADLPGSKCLQVEQ